MPPSINVQATTNQWLAKAWVRLHYVYPYPHVDDILPLMAEFSEHGYGVLPYLDIPLQHANIQVLVTWTNVALATSYVIYRSTDNVTFTLIASPVVNQYTDTAVTRGTQYFYKIAAVNLSGTSPFTSPLSIVPTGSGEMTLGQIRLAAQQRADLVNSGFVSTVEWNSYITQSAFELYDLLVTAYQDYYLAPAALFVTNGNNNAYPLPDGVTQFLNPDNTQNHLNGGQ